MDLWTEFLALVSQIVTPVWNSLIQYIPLLLVMLIPLVLYLVAFLWIHNGKRNASRVPPRLPDGRMPDGLHLPSPSPWPLVGAAGGFFIFLSLVLGTQTGPNLLFLAIGLAIGGIALVGWFMDARKEYDATEAGDHHLVLVPETEGVHVEPAIPEGIHLPAPSAWPLFAPIGLFFAFLGLALGPLLIVGGLIMALIAMIGWIIDAGKEYHEVADGVHPDPDARDPERHWPKRLMPLFGTIAAICIVLTMGNWILSLLPRTETADASGPKATTEPYVSAKSPAGFDQKRIVVPADTAFTITFDNQNAGVPHNIEIFKDPAKQDVYYDGETATGPETVDYAVDGLPSGAYPFICKFHPNMQGTLVVQ